MSKMYFTEEHELFRESLKDFLQNAKGASIFPIVITMQNLAKSNLFF